MRIIVVILSFLTGLVADACIRIDGNYLDKNDLKNSFQVRQDEKTLTFLPAYFDTAEMQFLTDGRRGEIKDPGQGPIMYYQVVCEDKRIVIFIDYDLPRVVSSQKNRNEQHGYIRLTYTQLASDNGKTTELGFVAAFKESSEAEYVDAVFQNWISEDSMSKISNRLTCASLIQ